jgi:hypothetical protein
MRSAACLLGIGSSLVSTAVAQSSSVVHAYGGVHGKMSACRVGMFDTILEGLEHCDACPPGQYQATSGTAWHQVCLDCPTGKYQQFSQMNECSHCPVGKHTILTGSLHASDCQSCPAGTFARTTPQGPACALPGEGLTATPTPAPTPHDTSATTFCKGGHFASGTQCFACPQGKYQPSDGEGGCKTCPTGRFQETPGSTKCNTCPHGKYHVQVFTNPGSADAVFNGQQLCYGCPAGKYQKFHGDFMCASCTAGKFSHTAATVCTDCPAGKASAHIIGEMTDCVTCSRGQFAAGTASLNCQFCATGQYSTHYGALTCAACSAPRAADVNTVEGQAAVTAACTVPTYAPTAFPTAEPTEAPTVEPTADAAVLAAAAAIHEMLQDSPTAAPTRAPTSGVLPWTCPAGKYMEAKPGTTKIRMDSHVCTFCAPGYFSSRDNQRKCVLCSKGSYATNHGATLCHHCPAGKFQRYVDFPAFCYVCPSGKYQLAAGSTSCVACAAGLVQLHSGETSCGPPVEAPTSQPTESPTVASTEEEVASEQLAALHSTEAGLQQQLASLTATTAAPTNLCTAGKFAGADGACNDCAMGQFSAAGLFECQECPHGRYQPWEGKAFCFTSPTTSDAPTPAPTPQHANCPGGKYAFFFHDEKDYSHTIFHCLACPVGRFSTGQGCEQCDVGQFTPVRGTSECRACSLGQYQKLRGMTSCTFCEAGRFAGTGNLACTKCPGGKFQTDTGRGHCESCEKGKYSSVPGNKVECVDCTKDFFSNLTGQDLCAPCPSGKHQPAVGQLECYLLPPQPTAAPTPRPTLSLEDAGCNAQQQAWINERVADGVYASHAAGVEALGCELFGQLATPSPTKSPTTFPTLFPTAQPTTSPTGVCSMNTTCARGAYRFVSDTHACFCITCPNGKYSDVANAKSCVACESGRFQLVEGQTSCKECVPGSYNMAIPADGGYISECLRCPSGKFQAKAGKTFCPNCQNGKLVNPEKTLCETYQSRPMTQNCQSGHYSVPAVSAQYSVDVHFAGQDSQFCVPCPAGKFQASIGEASCETCDAGEISRAHGLAACEACPAGQLANHKQTTCHNTCPAGKFIFTLADVTEQVMDSECVSCPAGKFSPSGSRLSCYDCSRGHYNQAAGQSNCSSLCPFKKSTDKAGTGCMTSVPIIELSGRLQAEVLFGQTYVDARKSCFDEADGSLPVHVSGYVNTTHPGVYYLTYTCFNTAGQEAIHKHRAVFVTSSMGQVSSDMPGGCEPGKYTKSMVSEDVSMTACVKCQTGRYQDEYGQAGCRPCTHNTESWDTCHAGFFLPTPKKVVEVTRQCSHITCAFNGVMIKVMHSRSESNGWRHKCNSKGGVCKCACTKHTEVEKTDLASVP